MSSEESNESTDRDKAIAEARRRAEGRPDLDDLPGLENVVPSHALLRQADLLDELRPRSARLGFADDLGRQTRTPPRQSLGQVMSRKAVSLVLKLFRPLREELERVLDFTDATALAYRRAAERIADLERELDELRKDSERRDFTRNLGAERDSGLGRRGKEESG